MSDCTSAGEVARAQIADEGPDVAVADVHVPADEDDLTQHIEVGSIGAAGERLNDRCPDTCTPRVEPRAVMSIFRCEPAHGVRSAGSRKRWHHRWRSMHASGNRDTEEHDERAPTAHEISV